MSLFHVVFVVIVVLAQICMGEYMQSGFIDMKGSRVGVEEGSKIFYWFTPAQEASEEAPLLIWLQGGPGSEGELGLFFEIGPYYLSEDLTLENRTVGNWNKVFLSFLRLNILILYHFSTTMSYF